MELSIDTKRIDEFTRDELKIYIDTLREKLDAIPAGHNYARDAISDLIDYASQYLPITTV